MTTAADSSPRVQVVVNGQRFESTVAVLTKYCLLFRFFFSGVSAVTDGAWQRCLDAAAAETAEKMRATAPPHLLPASAVVEQSDTDGGLWRFVFRSGGEKAALLPADVGVVLVHLRKRFRWEEVRTGAAPELPVRWGEMPYDAQLALALVVATFGVEQLAELYGRPTAQRVETEKDDAQFVNEACQRAEEYVRMRVGSGAPHASVDDDDLVLAKEACGRCGVTGHTDPNCPH